MSVVNLLDIQLVGENPTYFLEPFRIQIDFECLKELGDDLEWKLLYVGSAESEQYDQTLTSVLVGPIPVGRNRFVLETPPPDINKIPFKDVVGITAILLTCSFVNQEFVRVGYYVNNEYDTPEMRENPPKKADFNHIMRNILVGKPRVTRFPINWEIGPGQQIPFYELMSSGNSMQTDSNSLDNMLEEIIEPEEKQYISVQSHFFDFTQSLNTEISKRIFRWLLIPELVHCRRVSKKWKEIIDFGVQWESIDLSDWDWESEEQITNSAINFVVRHSSPQLISLKIPFCNLNDLNLREWLTKCSGVKELDLSYCDKINIEKTVELILNTCPEIEDLRIAYTGNVELIDFEFVEKICAKYRSLKFFHAHGMTNDYLNVIANYVGNSIRGIGVPNSEVNDEGILSFVKRCPNLKYLNLQLSEVTPKIVNQLRVDNFNVISSHSQDDITVDLTNEDDSVYVELRLKGRRQLLTTEDLKEVRKWVSFPNKIEYSEEYITYSGTIEEANESFKEFGFTNITVKQSEEDIDVDEEIFCQICKKSSDNENETVECDNCGELYHIYCLNPPLETSPVDEWYCEQCSDVEHPTKKRKI